MAKFNYTILSYHEGSNTRTFGNFTPTRKEAEAKLPKLRETYPELRFTVAAIKLDD